ncbi:MAG TPA: hypothetical protein PK725_15290, partial [Rhodocyclaceae bacterium]|nr:hypothetical protein [Rhodocyclaceae bacterium]
RFNCPHCHASVEPESMDSASSDLADYRICPVCDEPVVVAMRVTSPVPVAEGRVPSRRAHLAINDPCPSRARP